MSTLIKNGFWSNFFQNAETSCKHLTQKISNNWAQSELNVRPVERSGMSTCWIVGLMKLCTLDASLMIKAVLCLFCVDRLSRLSECICQTLLQVWALTRWSDFEVLSIKASKCLEFIYLISMYLSKTIFFYTLLFVFLYSITMLRFYIMKALLELVFTLFSCQIILVGVFVNEILQMCVK